jgi:RNA polymerase sigma-70 factor (ECF subfamily)
MLATLEAVEELQAVIDRCAGQNDAPALLEFVRLFHEVIAATVIKAARRFGPIGTELIDDLIQETYLRVFSENCRILRGLKVEHRSMIFGFVQAVTLSAVQDHFRREHAKRRGGGARVVPLQAAEVSGERGKAADTSEREILLDKLDRLLTEVGAPETLERDRLIFWFYYRQGFSARDIAELPSIRLSAKGVESVLQRLTAALRDKCKVIRPRSDAASQKKEIRHESAL